MIKAVVSLGVKLWLLADGHQNLGEGATLTVEEFSNLKMEAAIVSEALLYILHSAKNETDTP
jgi:hypothetical protein